MVILLPALLGAVATHPLHTTLTTIGWRSETRTVQVAVRVFTQDLSQALAHARPATGGGAEVGSGVCGYARAALMLGDATGRPLPTRGCTVERTADVTWIRLEVPARAPAGLHVLNAFLFELFPDQINIVQASLGGHARTVLFTRGDPPKSIG